MMSRRRALLIASLQPRLYNIDTISSLLLCEVERTYTLIPWYACKQFETDTDAGVFTMISPVKHLLSYDTPSIFTSSLCGKYCMKDVTTGSILYYFSKDCTYSLSHNVTTGMYSITAHGRIRVLTPILSS